MLSEALHLYLLKNSLNQQFDDFSSCLSKISCSARRTFCHSANKCCARIFRKSKAIILSDELLVFGWAGHVDSSLYLSLLRIDKALGVFFFFLPNRSLSFLSSFFVNLFIKSPFCYTE